MPEDAAVAVKKMSPAERKRWLEEKLLQRGDPWAAERARRKMAITWKRIRAMGEAEIRRVKDRRSIIIP